MPRVRVTVDHYRCAGVTMCTQLAPGAFAINGDGQSEFQAGRWELADLAEAADGCPMSAIAVLADDVEVT